MPKYLIAYRKTEETGQKPEWAVFTTDVYHVALFVEAVHLGHIRSKAMPSV